MKKDHIFFGVAQDGFTVQIACLRVQKKLIKIENLVSFSIAEEKDKEQSQTDSFFQDTMKEEPTGYNENFEEDSFEIPFGQETEEFEVLDKSTENGEAKSQTSADLEKNKSLREASINLKFCRGFISTNMDVSNVSYANIGKLKKATTAKISQLLESTFEDETNQDIIVYSYFKGNNEDIIGVSHEGKIELLENLITLNQTLGGKCFTYSYIQPNEISLINALRLNYHLDSNAISAVFYIGEDHSRVTLIKGKDFLLDLPIVNEGYRSKDPLKTLYSRYLLEKTQNNLPPVENFYLAGKSLNGVSIKFLKEKEPEANVEILLPKLLLSYELNNIHSKKDESSLQETIDYNKQYSENQLTEYIIPISLAMTDINVNHSDIIELNFLPKKLKQQQNFFAIDIKSFLTLGLIVVSFIVGLNIYFDREAELKSIQQQISLLETQVSSSRESLDEINQLNQQIEEIRRNLVRVDRVVSNKNQWHKRFLKISRLFYYNQHLGLRPSVNWIDYFNSRPNGFTMIGRTTNRRHIINISNLFNNSTINYINESEMFGYKVWEYEISVTERTNQ